MLNRTLLVLAAVSGLGLAGCASMSADECMLSDWRAVGFEDGSRGYNMADRFADRRKACSKHGIAPDFAEYRAGHAEGLRDYCQPERGFQLGANGGQYQGMCAADLEPEFVDAWRTGQHLHLLSSNVNSTANAIDYREQQLSNTRDRIRDTEAELIAAETTPQDRILLLADLKELAEEAGHLEAEIVTLSEERVHHQHELDAYRTSLANSGWY